MTSPADTNILLLYSSGYTVPAYWTPESHYLKVKYSILTQYILNLEMLMEPVGRRMVELAEVTVPSISAVETYDRMQSGQPVVVLDIREPDETEKGYIEGAVLLPRGRLEGRIEELVPDKNACIIAH